MINVEYTIKEDHLNVVVSGSVPTDYYKEFTDKISLFISDKNISKILVDCSNLEGSLSTADRFYYAEAIARKFWGVKIAFVFNNNLFEADRFGETVAKNRGANLKQFRNNGDALEWISEE